MYPSVFRPHIHELQLNPAQRSISALITQQYYCYMILIMMRHLNFPQGADSDHSKATYKSQTGSYWHTLQYWTTNLDNIVQLWSKQFRLIFMTLTAKYIILLSTYIIYWLKYKSIKGWRRTQEGCDFVNDQCLPFLTRSRTAFTHILTLTVQTCAVLSVLCMSGFC